MTVDNQLVAFPFRSMEQYLIHVIRVPSTKLRPFWEIASATPVL